MTNVKPRKRGRPPGARNKSPVQRMRELLPKMQRALLKKALGGDVIAIKACSDLVGEERFNAAMKKANTPRKKGKTNATQTQPQPGG